MTSVSGQVYRRPSRGRQGMSSMRTGDKLRGGIDYRPLAFPE
jgi:hypothetical protein